MLEQVWTLALDAMRSNQFLAGGFVLGAMAAVIHYCKEIPAGIWKKLKSQLLISVEVTDRDEAFRWLIKWLSEHPYSKDRARSLHAATSRDGEDNRPVIVLSPARGRHWFFYRRRLVILNRGREDGEGTPVNDSSSIRKSSGSTPETIRITVVGRHRGIIKELLNEAQELSHPKKEHRTSIMVGRWGDWAVRTQVRPRPIESVILKTGVMEDLIAQIQAFLDSEAWYFKRGIPYRLGVLLTGPPGSGKSSLVAAVASYFKRDLAMLSLAGADLGDENLQSLLSDVPNKTFVLTEDVDCVFEQRKQTEDNDSKVTFSGLLNAIDGVAAGEGRVLFMTTNHPEKLDPALIRPGRADLHYEIDAPDNGQLCRLYQRFFPQATDTQTLRFVEAVGRPEATSMAALQGLLTRYKHDPEKAIYNAHEVFAFNETQSVIQ